MDIYTRMREFYDYVECNPTPSGQIALWHALLYTNNKARWKEWFTVASGVLCNRSGLNRSSVLRARNALKQKGMIDFVPNGNRATKYRLLLQNEAADAPSDAPADAPADAPSDAPSDAPADAAADASANAPINKTKTKTKTKRNTYGTPNGVPGARARFTPPTIDEVRAYCQERGNSVNPEQWHNSYASKGWMVGKSPMKDWKAAVRTWESNRFGNSKPAQQPEKVYEEFTGWEA